MRRPLFGSGAPKLVATTPALTEVFDTTDFTPQDKTPQVYAVTLFAWAWQNVTPVADATKLPKIGVTVVTEGDAGIVVAERLPADFAAQQAAEIISVAKPTLLLERFLVRGDQQIYISNLNSAVGALPCYVYGYFEAVGRRSPTFPFRPLQPGPLGAPFSALPTLVSVVAPAAASYQTAHQLSNAYIDLLDISANVGGVGASEAPADGLCFLRFPGGVKLPLPIATGHVLFVSEVFEGQPIIAPAQNDVNIDVGFDASVTPGALAAAVYGGFTRR